MEIEFKHVDFGSLKALVTVKIGDMSIRGFKVIDSGNGDPWLGMPSRQIVRDGKTDYLDVVRFETPEARKKFQDEVLKAWKESRS